MSYQHEPWEETNTGSRGTAHGVITLISDGWSGEVVKNDGEHNHFVFDCEGSGSYANTNYTIEASGGYAFGGGGQIIGISLEHMGKITEESSNRITVQMLGMANNASHSLDFVPAWGALENDNALTVLHTAICVEDLIVNDSTSHNLAISNITFPYVYAGIRVLCDGNWYAVSSELTINTDLPIFETDADLLEYCQSGGLIRNKILNTVEVDPESEYNTRFDFWWIKAKWGPTRNAVSNLNRWANYRFYPKRQGIAFIRHTPTSEEPWDRELVNYSGYTMKMASWGEDSDDDFDDIETLNYTHFLTKSISFGQNDYWTKYEYATNIPLWGTRQDADDYFNGLKDISEALNYDYIARQDETILNPDLAGTDADELTELGTNGMAFTYGNRLYEVSNIELSQLMTELFTPANYQDILDGNKLFGSNAMEAISGVIYIPLSDLSEVCEVGSLSNIQIGSWQAQGAQGKRINKNNKTIDCGSFFYNRVYNDFRDYEPYNLLFANLPFVGMHQLTISKYIDKTVGCTYNIDITTGAIVCKLTADGILVDVFDGTCGASRPISATDNNAYINNIVGAITGASSQASGSIEGITNMVGGVGKATGAGGLLGAAGVGAGIGIAGAGIAASGIYTGYQIKNAVDNPPQMHRGSLAGNLAYNLNTKPTFLFFTKRTIRPENELAVVGYPSGHGAQIGAFAGFLSCSAVKLANFNGTETEQNEILNILKGGIYI